MKFVRYLKGNTEYRGIIDGDVITRINGTIFHDFILTDDKIDIKDIKILPPILPTKIIGFRKNYKMAGIDDIVRPMMFFKPPTSIIADGDDIIIPNAVEDLMIEGEIAVVIGKKCSNVSPEKAKDFIFGATITNDITGLSKLFPDSFSESKSYNTFTPLGIFINDKVDYNNLKIQSYINGNLVQEGYSSDMVFNTSKLISFTSEIMTLLPGDILLTGTPSKAVKAVKGDLVTIVVENLGSLSNRVI